MNATRRTVIGWLLAACIAPPRWETVAPSFDGFGLMLQHFFGEYVKSGGPRYTHEWVFNDLLVYGAAAVDSEGQRVVPTSIEIDIS